LGHVWDAIGSKRALLTLPCSAFLRNKMELTIDQFRGGGYGHYPSLKKTMLQKMLGRVAQEPPLGWAVDVGHGLCRYPYGCRGYHSSPSGGDRS
jgi:hypothetical protein